MRLGKFSEVVMQNIMYGLKIWGGAGEINKRYCVLDNNSFSYAPMDDYSPSLPLNCSKRSKGQYRGQKC